MHWLRQLTTINHPDAQVRQRGHLLAIVLLAIIILLVCFIPINLLSSANSFSIFSVPVIMLVEIGLLVLARRGMVTLSGWLFVLVTIVSVLSTAIFTPAVDPGSILTFLILCIITAGIVLPPRHIWGVMAICVVSCGLVLVVRSDLASNMIVTVSVLSQALILVVGGVIAFLGARATQQALESAAVSTQQATDAQQRAEAQTREIAKQAEVLGQTQQQLQDLVATLETPTVSLVDGVMLAPLIGALDSRRAAKFTERLLNDVATQHVRLLVLDIAGVAVIDTAVAATLTHVVQAVRLLGCQAVLTGIGPEVAMTLTHLGVDLQGIQTARSPQQVLESLALGTIGQQQRS